MAGPSVQQLQARIAQLERQVAELTQRLRAYERGDRPRQENPVDRKTVQEKVVYDWQS
ncbi:MAG TPA: hypothetical protein VKT21_02300 [Thermoplasmata archaeon]|nr:hypothetical protein [Thermoplasmata archaeon]